MENQQTISGTEAIRRARNLKYVPGASFTLIHLTCNLKTKQCGEVSKTERCRVRPALVEDTFQLDGDLYFTYEDMDIDTIIKNGQNVWDGLAMVAVGVRIVCY
jgi:hypothetical protein